MLAFSFYAVSSWHECCLNCSMTPEHRYRSAHFEGKRRPFISLSVLKSGLRYVLNVLILKLSMHFNQMVMRTQQTVPQFTFIYQACIWVVSLGIGCCLTNCQDVSSSKVFCVLCSLFSSKTQDVYRLFCLHFCSVSLVTWDFTTLIFV